MPDSLQARVVFPVDSPPVEHGVVTLAGERIIAVGKTAGGPARDLGNVALLPGFVNAHTHLEFSHLRRPLGQPGMRLIDWIRLVIAERKRSDVEASVTIAEGLRESAAAGVAAIGEIATGGWPGPGPRLGVPAGMALALFFEVIGFSLGRAASVLSSTAEQLDTTTASTHHGTVIELGISPHAPYTVSPVLLERLVSLTQRRGLPLAMHLAESREELELLSSGTGPFQELLDERSMWDDSVIPRGSRPLNYLQRLAEAPRSLLIHGNYLDAEEHQFLATRADRMSLVYCPRTHAYFGHPRYPLSDLFAAGVRVALGTDSRASNPDLDLWAEMCYVARKYPEVAPSAILRMGTLDGARALGFDARLGSLTPGKLANLVAVPLPASANGGADEILSALFHSAEPPTAVWLRGEEWQSGAAR